MQAFEDLIVMTTGVCSSPELSGMAMNCTPNYSSGQDSADIGVLLQNGHTLSITQKLNLINNKVDTTKLTIQLHI